jgi:hypothetical protein
MGANPIGKFEQDGRMRFESFECAKGIDIGGQDTCKGSELRDELPGKRLDIFLGNGIGQEQL